MNGQINLELYLEEESFKKLSQKAKNRIYFYHQGYLKDGRPIITSKDVEKGMEDISEALMEMGAVEGTKFLLKYIKPIMQDLIRSLNKQEI